MYQKKIIALVIHNYSSLFKIVANVVYLTQILDEGLTSLEVMHTLYTFIYFN